MNNIGDITRFTFNSQNHILAEQLEDLQIIMYWEFSKEVCPHCKEVIIKGEHCLFDFIEIWITVNKEEKDCKLADLVILGRNETRTLLLTKDKIIEALTHSKKFSNLKD